MADPPASSAGKAWESLVVPLLTVILSAVIASIIAVVISRLHSKSQVCVAWCMCIHTHIIVCVRNSVPLHVVCARKCCALK